MGRRGASQSTHAELEKENDSIADSQAPFGEEIDCSQNADDTTGAKSTITKSSRLTLAQKAKNHGKKQQCHGPDFDKAKQGLSAHSSTLSIEDLKAQFSRSMSKVANVNPIDVASSVLAFEPALALIAEHVKTSEMQKLHVVALLSLKMKFVLNDFDSLKALSRDKAARMEYDAFAADASDKTYACSMLDLVEKHVATTPLGSPVKLPASLQSHGTSRQESPKKEHFAIIVPLKAKHSTASKDALVTSPARMNDFSQLVNKVTQHQGMGINAHHCDGDDGVKNDEAKAGDADISASLSILVPLDISEATDGKVAAEPECDNREEVEDHVTVKNLFAELNQDDISMFVQLDEVKGAKAVDEEHPLVAVDADGAKSVDNPADAKSVDNPADNSSPKGEGPVAVPTGASEVQSDGAKLAGDDDKNAHGKDTDMDLPKETGDCEKENLGKVRTVPDDDGHAMDVCIPDVPEGEVPTGAANGNDAESKNIKEVAQEANDLPESQPAEITRDDDEAACKDAVSSVLCVEGLPDESDKTGAQVTERTVNQPLAAAGKLPNSFEVEAPYLEAQRRKMKELNEMENQHQLALEAFEQKAEAENEAAEQLRTSRKRLLEAQEDFSQAEIIFKKARMQRIMAKAMSDQQEADLEFERANIAATMQAFLVPLNMGGKR